MHSTTVDLSEIGKGALTLGFRVWLPDLFSTPYAFSHRGNRHFCTTPVFIEFTAHRAQACTNGHSDTAPQSSFPGERACPCFRILKQVDPKP